MNIKEKEIIRTKKTIILLLIIFMFLLFLIFSIFLTVFEDRKNPAINISKKELAVRGNIYSSDNFKITSSKKIYKTSIDTRYLDSDKKELFAKLFSIYSDIPYKKILKKVNNSLKRPSNLVLSYNINSRTAKNLKELSFKLRKLGVFKPIKINGTKVLRALSVVESGEKRVFSYKDTLTPIIGYTSKYESKNDKTRVLGVKGLEKQFDNYLDESKDGILSGNRDVLSYITFDKKSILRPRTDGANLHLNIPLKLQKNVEMILDNYKNELKAKEILVSVMNSKSGKILTLASSNRFNPEKILQREMSYLNVKAVEYPFEPGSVIKPISIALVLDKKRVKKEKLFSAYNFKGKANNKGEYQKGKYTIGRHSIKDDHRFKKHYLTIDDIVIHSSNIGTLQLAQKLSGKEMLEGMQKFGFSKKSGIELPHEKRGKLPSLRQLSAGENRGKDNVYKATVSYGHGMTSTFIQVLKAYSVFNNQGIIKTPKLLSFIENKKGKYTSYDEKEERIISKETAKEIKRLLIKTVKKGTGKSANIEGLEIGGKTGTAQIARGKNYQKEYISSFFGFANDKKSSYTIGITVFNPNSKGKKWYQYYASNSAVPVFKEVVTTLVKLGFLDPELKI